MSTFLWEGKAQNGEVRKGMMEAPNYDAVRAKLRSQQIQPTKVRKQWKEIEIKLPGFGGGVAQKELVIFTRQFATMIDAGLPLVQCLEILGSQQSNIFFKKILVEIKQTVEGGSTFADALRKHPKVFDDLFVNLVSAGEVGGILDSIMNRLAAYIEKNMKMKKRVKAAMTYPTIVFIVAIGVLVAMLTFIIPKFKDMFEGMGGASLPAPTQMVLTMSNFFRHHSLILVIVSTAVIVLVRLFLKSKTGSAIFDDLILKVPMVGGTVRKVAVARFTRTMGTMLSSGVPILDALDIVSQAAGNQTVARAIKFTKEKISAGTNMADPLAQTKIFPSMVVQMIAVGESTGQMDTMLTKIAEFYEEEVDTAVEALTAAIEPLMMVVLGGMVGFFLVSMYLPIFQLAKNV